MRQFKLPKDSGELVRLSWSRLFSDESVGLQKGTPAQILEHILNKRWVLQSSDKDMIVMIHRFKIELQGKVKTIQASLVAKGDDAVHTAMAKTVGLPMGIAAKLLLQGKIKSRGVQIPTMSEIYDPVLEELKKFDVVLFEH